MPEHDLATLITLNIGMTMTGVLGAMIGVWAIIREMGRNTRGITTITREVAFMIRRQYADIDRDLQEIKDLFGGAINSEPIRTLPTGSLLGRWRVSICWSRRKIEPASVLGGIIWGKMPNRLYYERHNPL